MKHGILIQSPVYVKGNNNIKNWRFQNYLSKSLLLALLFQVHDSHSSSKSHLIRQTSAFAEYSGNDPIQGGALVRKSRYTSEQEEAKMKC